MRQSIIPFVDHEIGYRLLQILIALSLKDGFYIPAVVTTQSNKRAWWPGVDELCLRNNIPLYIYDECFVGDCLALRPDWFLLLSWKHVLVSDIIDFPKKGIINLHYSLLPDLRGAYPVNWSIIKGKNKTGFTYHFVNEKIDDGEIFMQVEVPILLSDTARSLQLRMDDFVCNNFDKFIESLLNFGAEKSDVRKEKEKEKEKEYYSINKFREICSLDLDKYYSGMDFLNLLRGLTFFHESKNAYFFDKESGKKIYVSIELNEENIF